MRRALTMNDEALVLMPTRVGYDDSIVAMPEMDEWRVADPTVVLTAGLGLGAADVNPAFANVSDAVAKLLPASVQKQVKAAKKAVAKAASAQASPAGGTVYVPPASSLPSWAKPAGIAVGAVALAGLAFFLIKRR